MTLNSAREQQVTDWLAEREQDMLDLTEELVNIDSGSYDKPGVDAVGAVLRRFLETADIPCDTIAIADRGDALRATVSGPAGNRPILLMGHRDTVFDKGEAKARPYTIENGRAYGPGVADMKSGLVMNAFILAAFAKFGGPPAPVIGLFTGDEEIGSPQSRPIIEAEARHAQAVFNSEPGRASGNVVTARKGGVFFRCDIFGKSAHSGANFQEGVSAIEELARKIQAWHTVIDLDAGTTVNVGLISGGQSVNSVAPHARCEIDTRYIHPGDRDALVQKITSIAEHCSLDGARAEIEIMGEFKPVSQSDGARALFESYIRSAKDLGFEVGGEFTGGCADSGFTSAIGTPTLCGLGPVGGKAHSPDEYIEVASFVPRAQAVALAVMRLGTDAP